MSARMFLTISLLFLSPVTFADEVTFSRDIRPILSANCFGCHGTDEAHREANLRLDTFSGATADPEGRAAIVPGKPEASELLARVKSQEADVVMPPRETGKVLTPQQIELLEKWIRPGAEYQQHWAFVPPVAPQVPEFSDQQSQRWIRNPIDAFVLRRLQSEGLGPSPVAESATLLAGHPWI
ncbi:MAG: c-type cytochrome domain-containing protein [Planctomycetaceae bacterium]